MSTGPGRSDGAPSVTRDCRGFAVVLESAPMRWREFRRSSSWEGPWPTRRRAGAGDCGRLLSLVTPMAIRVAATLRLADRIAAGTRTAGELATAVDADPDALARLLGHLVTAGVLSRAGNGSYGLTALGEHLRDDDPAGVRPWLDLGGAIGRADLCFTQLLHTVRTGEPAFPRQFGVVLGRPVGQRPAGSVVRRADGSPAGGGRAGHRGRLPLGRPWSRRRCGRRQRQPADRDPARPRRAARHGARPGRPGRPRRASDRLRRPGPPGPRSGRELLRCPSRRSGRLRALGHPPRLG